MANHPARTDLYRRLTMLRIRRTDDRRLSSAAQSTDLGQKYNTRQRDMYCRIHDLDFGLGYRIASIEASEGALSHIDQPIAVGSGGPTVVMLSASGGMMSADPRTVIDQAFERLLECVSAGAAGTDEVLARFKDRLFQLYQQGAFCGALPNGAALTVTRDFGVMGVRFGPVGVALDDGVETQLLHPDDRFPALTRAGVPLGDLLPPGVAAEPLVMAVSGITQLDPAEPQVPLRAAVAPRDSVLVLSRGAMPFCVPGAGASLQDWARLEAGWMHGMRGTVLQVLRCDDLPGLGGLPWGVG